jgi:hypothetical protein
MGVHISAWYIQVLSILELLILFLGALPDQGVLQGMTWAHALSFFILLQINSPFSIGEWMVEVLKSPLWLQNQPAWVQIPILPLPYHVTKSLCTNVLQVKQNVKARSRLPTLVLGDWNLSWVGKNLSPHSLKWNKLGFIITFFLYISP